MFQKAVKNKSRLRCALFGPSGAGKTFTALRIATGIAKALGDERVALIDTEYGSASKYADRIAFDTLRLDNDQAIGAYITAIGDAAKAGYPVLIIDSMTHGWQELLQEIDELAKTKYHGNSFQAWSEGTPKHKSLVKAIQRYPGHLLATMRSKTVWDVVKDERTGKMKPERAGAAPEQGKGIEYEFDLLLELTPEHWCTVLKDRTGKYQDARIETPGEEFGESLYAWLNDGVEPEPPYATLQAAIEKHGITADTTAKWLEHFGAATLVDLTGAQIDAILRKLEKEKGK